MKRPALRLFGALVLLSAGCQSAVVPPGELVFRLPAMGVAEPIPAPMHPHQRAPEPEPTPTPRFDGARVPGGSGGVSAPRGTVTLTTADGYGLARVGEVATPLTTVAGLTVDPQGNVYAVDPARQAVVALPPTGPAVVVAGLGDGRAGYWGDGVPADATPLSAPAGLCRDPYSGLLILADAGNGRIRLFLPGGRIITWVGGGSTTTETVTNPRTALLDQPVGVALDGLGRLFITERGSGRVRRLEVDQRLTTVATLEAGALGPIAVRWEDGLAWVGEGGRIRALDPVSPDPAATPVLDLPGQLVQGLAYDQAGELFALVTDGGGRSGTQVLRLVLGADGTPAGEWEAIAGSGGQDAVPAAYQAPATPIADARTQLLAGLAPGGLAIDLSRAADPAALAGQLYVGNGYDAGGTRWGQVLRLTPIQ